MKKKWGIIAGFVFGALVGFLAIFIFSKLHPEEDFAGVTILALLLSGFVFAIAGYLIQTYFTKKKA
jgi:drug/metabolite transporter (DMT)-like permease